MAILQAFLIGLCTIAFYQSSVNAKFSKSMYITWGQQHAAIQGNGEDVQLVLDQTSGYSYLFLWFSVQMHKGIIVYAIL